MRNPKLQLVIGILISGLFMYLAMRGVRPADLRDAILSFNWLWAGPFLFLTFASLWVRAVRWKYLMKPAGEFTSKRLFYPMMAGFAINSLLPARVGEFARAYVLGKKEKLPFASVFATIVVERIFDSITLLILLAFVFGTLKMDASISYTYSSKGEVSYRILGGALAFGGIVMLIAAGTLLAAWKKRSRQVFRNMSILAGIVAITLLAMVPWFFGKPGMYSYGQDYEISGAGLKALSRKITYGCLVLVAGSFLLLWPTARDLIQRASEQVPYAPRAIRMKISGIIGKFADGLASLKSVRTVLIVFGLSVVVWLLVAWSMQIMPYGIPEMRAMTFTEATAILVISCIAILIPAAPGYWGLMEIGIIFGLTILHIETDRSRALAYSLLVHGLQYFPIVAVGLYCLWKEQVSLGEISHIREEEAPA